MNSLPIEPMDFQLNLTLTDAFVSNGNIKLYLLRMDLSKFNGRIKLDWRNEIYIQQHPKI